MFFWCQLKAALEVKTKALEKQQAVTDKICDEIFKEFCKEVGISNIQEFEGGTSTQVREHNDRVNLLARTLSTLAHKISTARATEDRLKSSIQQKTKEKEKLEAEIKDLKSKESQSKEAIKKGMDDKAEEVRKRNEIKAEIDEQDAELKKVQDILKRKQDERDTAQKLVEKVESTIELLNSQRKTVLDQSQLEEISLPKRGQRSSQGGEDGGDAEDDPMDVDDSQVEMSQSESATLVRKEIKGASLDYSSLRQALKRDMNDKERKKVLSDLDEERKATTDILSTMNPNMKAMEQLNEVMVRYDAAQQEMHQAKQRVADVNRKFDEVKKQRCELFNTCFEHVKSCIDSIYKVGGPHFANAYPKHLCHSFEYFMQ
jgi:structural maintenance of chromosome 1